MKHGAPPLLTHPVFGLDNVDPHANSHANKTNENKVQIASSWTSNISPFALLSHLTDTTQCVLPPAHVLPLAAVCVPFTVWICDLVPVRHYFRKFWKLEGRPSWRKEVTGGRPLGVPCLPVQYLLPVHQEVKRLLPHMLLSIVIVCTGPSPLKLWIQVNLSSLDMFPQVFWSQQWESQPVYHSCDPDQGLEPSGARSPSRVQRKHWAKDLFNTADPHSYL